MEAEESEAFTIGVMYNVTDTITLGVDYFNLSIDNVISSVTTQDRIFAELAGETGYVIRKPNGEIDEVYAGVANVLGFELQTLDFTAKGSYETAYGELGFNLLFSQLLEYTRRPTLVPECKTMPVGIFTLSGKAPLA